MIKIRPPSRQYRKIEAAGPEMFCGFEYYWKASKKREPAIWHVPIIFNHFIDIRTRFRQVYQSRLNDQRYKSAWGTTSRRISLIKGVVMIKSPISSTLINKILLALEIFGGMAKRNPLAQKKGSSNIRETNK
jgi:hypothetical protein